MRPPGDAAQSLAASDADLARALARQIAPATGLVVLCALILSDVAERPQCDEAMRTRLNRWLADAASSATERYRDEAAAFAASRLDFDARSSALS